MSATILLLLRRAWPYLLAIALLGIIALQYRQIGRLHEQLGAERSARAAAVEANRTQSETITDLERAVAQWKQAAAVSDDIRSQAAQAAAYREQLERRAADVKEVKTRESPDCKTLLAVDFGARCSVLARRLRELADRDRKDTDRGSAGPGGTTSP